MSVRFARADGRDLGWRIERWVGNAEPEELDVLRRVAPPVLDIGCGPGRHVIALARMGVMALGVDIAPTAVAIANARGAPVLERSIFERLPGAGRWGSALLLDGNIGIGGEPEILLTRVRGLLRAGGLILVEVHPPTTPTERISVRLDAADGRSPSFPWATIGAGDLEVVAGRSGLKMTRLWCANDRWFGCLVC